ncbi:unnamed protein product, partial [Mesorhabditis spiculigera]
MPGPSERARPRQPLPSPPVSAPPVRTRLALHMASSVADDRAVQMKFKSLGDRWLMRVLPTDTIGHVKECVRNLLGRPNAPMMLIHEGQALQNDAEMFGGCGYQEGSAIIVVLMKERDVPLQMHVSSANPSSTDHRPSRPASYDITEPFQPGARSRDVQAGPDRTLLDFTIQEAQHTSGTETTSQETRDMVVYENRGARGFGPRPADRLPKLMEFVQNARRPQQCHRNMARRCAPGAPETVDVTAAQWLPPTENVIAKEKKKPKRTASACMLLKSNKMEGYIMGTTIGMHPRRAADIDKPYQLKLTSGTGTMRQLIKHFALDETARKTYKDTMIELIIQILGIGPSFLRDTPPCRVCVTKIPLTRMLVETDAPYFQSECEKDYPLTPKGTKVFKRQPSNHPAACSLVITYIAKLKGKTFREIADITREGTRRFFQLDRLPLQWHGPRRPPLLKVVAPME